MVTREHGLVFLLIVALVFIVLSDQVRSEALDRAETLESAIPALTAQRDAAKAAADSVTRQALRMDTVVAAVRDSAAVESNRLERQVRRVSRAFASRGDSLRSMVDTLAIRLIDERDAMFEVALASKDSIIGVRNETILAVTLWGEGWRDASFSKDTLIARWDSLYTVESQINDNLRDHIKSQRRKGTVTKVVAVLAVAASIVLR